MPGSPIINRPELTINILGSIPDSGQDFSLFHKIFISKQIFTLSHNIVLITNTNNYEYIKQKLKRG